MKSESEKEGSGLAKELREFCFCDGQDQSKAPKCLACRAADYIEDGEKSFDIRWRADMRAIKRWQEAHPGNDLVWPDHADLCVWLLGELDKLKTAVP